MIPGSNSGLLSVATAAYLLEQSLLFDGAAYLSRTPSTAGNRKTWTFSCWVKLAGIGDYMRLFCATPSSGDSHIIIRNTGEFHVTDGGASGGNRASAALLRDPNAWYHLVTVFDTTNATADDRLRMYINGVRVTEFSSTYGPTNPTLNADTWYNAAVEHRISSDPRNNNQFFDGLMALPILVDGAALDPTSFGEEDADGYWNPIEFAGADTVAYIPFGEGSVITDYSAETADSFDGVFTSQAAGSGNVSRSASTTSCYMGKNFSASPRTVSGVICFGSNDQGFVHTDASASNVTLSLYGKNGGAPSNATDGTSLGSSTFTRTSNESAGRYFASSDAVTEYDYIWIRTSHDGSADTCYMTEITFETSTGNGYGTNGGAYDFAINTAYGTDVSGNGNDFTDSGFATTDQLADTPTDDADLEIGNYATLNSNDRLTLYATPTFSEGNLAMGGAGNNCDTRATHAVSSGKHYFEMKVTTYAAGIHVGVTKASDMLNTTEPPNQRVYYAGTGNKKSGSTLSAYGATYTTNDIIGVAVDLDVGEIEFFKNNVSQDVAFTDLTVGDAYMPLVDTNNGGAILMDFGQRGFTYTPPAGYQALATQNLTDVAIDVPSLHMNTVLYTGNGTAIGSGGNAITGVGFQPDFVWMKSRSAATDHALYDSVRGATKEIISNSTAAESTLTEGLTAFGTDGFTLGSDAAVNTSSATYVAWCWKAGGTAASNTDGTITSSVSANTTSGFSIVTYTGTGAAATVGHGLGVPNDFMIFKSRSNTSSPGVVTSALGFTKDLLLEATDAAYTRAAISNNTAPTSTVFSVGTDTAINASGYTYVAYCWAEVEGFSKFGSYTGVAGDGPLQYCGFKPAFVLIKSSSNAGNGWGIFDAKRNTYNPVTSVLNPHGSGAEGNYGTGINFLSTGFKPYDTSGELNATGYTYIYAAFAEHPFQGDDGVTQARAR